MVVKKTASTAWVFAAALLALLAWPVIHFLLSAIRAIVYPAPLDYGEGLLVDQAMRMAAGQSIYRTSLSAPPYTVSNYTPLYILATAPFVKLFGPNFWAGRAISVVSALASSAFSGLIVWELGRNRLAAVASGMLLLASPIVVHWAPLNRVDMLALFFSLAGIWVLVRWPQSAVGLIVGGGLFVCAAYTRQSYGLAGPMTMFVWRLICKDWRGAAVLAAWTGGLGLGLFFLLNLLTQGGFFYNIVTANISAFHWNSQWTAPFAILVFAAASLILIMQRRSKQWVVAGVYLIGGTLAAMTIGNAGSSINYLIEIFVALNIVEGLLIALADKSWIKRLLVLAVLALQVWGMMRFNSRLDVLMSDMYTNPIRAAQIDQMQRLVRAADGPVLADGFNGLITLENRPIYLQPCEMSRLANAGQWDQRPLLNDIAQHKFPLILVSGSECWTSQMLQAIGEYYRQDAHLASTVVYVPRQ